MLIRRLLFLLLCFSEFAYAELPLSFTSTPTINDMALGQVQVLDYTIRNNLSKQSLPLLSVQVINEGDQQPNTLTSVNSSCPSTLAPQTSCDVSVIISSPNTGAVKRKLIINYGGRAPLTAPIAFSAARAAYTILIYIVGTDLESESNAATFNINQMKQVGSTSKINIVIETGGANKNGWRTVLRKLILKNAEFLLQNLGSLDMGLETSVESFFEWGVRNFPADRYFAIFWDHGGGPNGGFGGDEVHNDSRTPINQLSSAMQTVTQNTGAHFEIIGFDTCLLGNIETLAGLRLYTNYFIGSEDLEPGLGWQYNTFLNFINSNPTANGLAIGRNIVDGFTVQNKDDTTTLSVMSSAEVPNLISALNQFTSALSPYVNSTVANWKLVARARIATPDYSTSAWDRQSYDVADLLEFAQQATTIFNADPNVQAASGALITAVQNTVKYFKNSSNRAGSFGLTIYFPSILASYVTSYPMKTLINGVSFFSTAYTSLVSNYYDFYVAQANNLIATPSNLAFDGTSYTATVSNDFEENMALVGNDACTDVHNTDGSLLPPVPCYTAMESNGIIATPAGGNTWNISYNKADNASAWALINGQPVILITQDTEPVIPNEAAYIVPVIRRDGTVGYLTIKNQNNEYTVTGFQRSATTQTAQAKISDIQDGTRFFIRTYAFVSGNWILLRRDTEITAPFTITFGTVPSEFNAFRFLVSDLTGQLNMTTNSVPY